MPNHVDREALSDHLDGVRRLVRTLVRDDHEVDDVVQDTMVAALESRTQVRSGLRAWLGGVARNVVRRTARSEGRRAKHETAAGDLPRATPSTADVIARAAEQRRVLDALLGLAEPYRSAVLLRFVEDLPPRRVAKRLDVPVETVRTQIKRGLLQLREQLEADHGGSRGELHVALTLAGTEPLGAAHARAVALAQASGLVVLLLLGAGLWIWLAGHGEPSGQSTAPDVLVERPAPASGTVPLDPAPPDVPGVDGGSAPAPGSSGAAGGDGETDGAPEDGVSSGTTPVAPEAPPVRPIPDAPKKPAPRIAVEKEKPSGKEPPGKGTAKKPDAGAPPKGGEPEDDDDGDGPEFFEEETTFSPKEVGRAIDKGAAWLLKRQRRDGSWGAIKFNSTYKGGQTSSEGMHAGPTALALYALLKCKTPVNHDQVKRGFAYLEKHFYKPPTSYETSMLLLAITARADSAKLLTTSRKRKAKRKLTSKYALWASKLRDHLLRKREARGWRYNRTRGTFAPGGPEDLSSTQLAALALFSAHRISIKVDRRVWEDILAFSMDQQMPDGPEVVYADPIDPKKMRKARARGFAYIRSSDKPHEAHARGGMTACGLANIEMARFVLTDGGRKRAAWDKRPDAAKVQEAIYDGLAWLDKNWSPFEDPHAKTSNVYHIYWMYALERAMDLFALRLVGKHNWYNEMGQELLNRQVNGHWDVNGVGGGHDVLDTCFSLLFLKRATRGPIPHGSVTGGGDGPVDNR